MNRQLIQRLIGSALILSGVILLLLMILSISEAREHWDAWASPHSGTVWFVSALVLELVLLMSRCALGYLLFFNRRIKPWLFYPLGVLTAISGFSGMVLALLAVVLRFWQGGGSVAKGG